MRPAPLIPMVVRGFTIALVALQHVFKIIVLMLDRRRSLSLNTASGIALACALERLGPTFIKIGQLLSARPDVVGPAVSEALSRLRDRVRPMPRRELHQVLQAAFPSGYEHVFESFDEVPVASASIAQVHRALLGSGLDVAVKLRRLGLERKVQCDLAILECLGAVLEKLPGMQAAPMRDTMREFGHSILAQLDFRTEARNYRTARVNFADLEAVVIPFLVEELCGDSVLVMEFIEGGRSVFAPGPPRDDDRAAAQTLLQILYRMVFVDGFVHADLHPGNIFFLDHGRVLLLDFGLVARLEDNHLEHFTEFFFGMISNDGQRCAEVIRKTATFINTSVPFARFETLMQEIVSRHWLELTRDYEVARFALELFDAQRQCMIRGATTFVMVIWSFVVFEGLIRRLDPDLDFQAEARLFIPAVLRKRKERGMLLVR
jgi:ubiquinone biosynthesis protein